MSGSTREITRRFCMAKPAPDGAWVRSEITFHCPEASRPRSAAIMNSR